MLVLTNLSTKETMERWEFKESCDSGIIISLSGSGTTVGFGSGSGLLSFDKRKKFIPGTTVPVVKLLGHPAF